jgi:hypothetical protein
MRPYQNLNRRNTMNRIKNLVLSPVTAYLFIKDVKSEMEYEAMIAESQAKIGPYVPTPCPVQVWA